jgi:polysaccharide pyruvyl transferase WcaK-like protein
MKNSPGGDRNHFSDETATSTTETSPKGHKISREGFFTRIALLSPYAGANLGDAAIQDAMVANASRRLPNVQFSGICLNCENFVERHGAEAFPLLAKDLEWYAMTRGRLEAQPDAGERHESSEKIRGVWANKIRRALKRLPILGLCLRVVAAIPKELRHCFKGYRFLRTQDLVVVSGGGQLNEQYGGAWGQPFALFKWAVLARVAQVPFAITSVGVGELKSTASRLYVSEALRLACYRSYRDKPTKDFAIGLLQRAATDSIVPDLAFSLTSSELPPIASIGAIAGRRTVIAISPIVYAKPERWPVENSVIYDRYVEQLAQVVAELLRRDYFLVMVWSSLVDDESVIGDLLGRLDPETKQRLASQLHVPTIETWRDYVATLRNAHFLIASRLHSTILGFMSEMPTIAISFDRKVDTVMEDVGQTDYLLQIHNFTSDDVLRALDRLQLCRDAVLQQVSSYRCRILPILTSQYDTLARIARAGNESDTRTTLDSSG